MSAQLKKCNYEGINISESDSTLRIDTIAPFVKHVSTAVSSNLFGEDAFLPQIDSFSYSVGPLYDLCDYLGVNAVMFIFGADEHYSELRRDVLKRSAALKTARSMFWATISSILLGVGHTEHTRYNRSRRFYAVWSLIALEISSGLNAILVLMDLTYHCDLMLKKQLSRLSPGSTAGKKQ
jgi:hypothetical protein